MYKFLIIPYIIIEILITANFVDNNGFLFYLMEILLSGLFGVFIISKSAEFGLANIVKTGFGAIFDELGYVIGGILLLIPGILCDIFGLIALLAVFIKSKFLNTQNYTQNNSQNNTKYKQNDNSEIIDVEIIEEEKK